MGERLKGKVAIVVGAGQTPGETMGNGRATAITFAREGARLLLVDRRLDSAEDTRAIIEAEGGTAATCEADVTDAADCARFAETCMSTYGRVDILHNNVGIGGGDRGLINLAEEDWDNILNVNLKGMFLSCKHVMPYLVEQGGGAIVNISSVAAVCAVNMLAYKTSKAGLNALSHSIAMGAAGKGVRVNVIMPGLMNTPMAIEGHSAARGITREQLISERDGRVPLKGGMGSAWDIANAALFLASDEAKFITGVVLPVDGGQAARIG